MNTLILAINPGSTSTKIGLFDGETLLFKESLEHGDEFRHLGSIIEQAPLRKKHILDFLARHGYTPEQLACVMGRGGLLPPIHAGGYRVNEKMRQYLRSEDSPQHASNLGAILADEIAQLGGVNAYIYDAVSANEFTEIAKITGMPEIVRKSFYHVLNSRASAIRYAESKNKSYEEMNLIVAHLGGGITIGVHQEGRIVDSLSDDNGPFSPERAGSLPLLDVIEICYSGQYQKKEMAKKIRGMGGLRALIGTADCRKIEAMIQEGDERAKLVFEAQAYQIAKGIGLLSPVLKGKCDAIILTGGVAHSAFITDRVAEYVRFIAPIEVMPGEFELEALAAGGLRILKGKEKTYEF